MNPIPLRRAAERPVRILLVEDEIFLRMDVAASLRNAGFEVIEAARADAALEYVQSGEPVDLLLTDIRTPGDLDGLTLAERVLTRHPDMPVVIASGSSDVESRARNLGEFVPKPYDPQRIARLIATLMQ